MRRRHLLLGLAILGSVTSCKSSLEIAGGSLPGIGSFTLVQVDGNPLPYRGTTTITLRGGLTIQTNTQYVLTQTDSAIAGGPAATTTHQGVWTLTDNSYVFHDGNAVVGLAAVSGNGDTLRATITPSVLVYLYVKN